MFDRAIKVEALQDFKTHLHGELIAPGDDTYDSARKVWNGMIDKYPALIARCADVIEPFATAETYTNYLEDEGEAQVRTSYGATYERLARVKNAYDPTNFFHLNHNIKPTVER